MILLVSESAPERDFSSSSSSSFGVGVIRPRRLYAASEWFRDSSVILGYVLGGVTSVVEALVASFMAALAILLFVSFY